jgi:dolichol-phosphate mannosyltransferase
MHSCQKENINKRLAEVDLGIVCPMANESETAVDFVKCVLRQCGSFKSVKFFTVFDNTCKDGTVDLLKDLKRQEPRLQVVWAPENSCVVDAYIRGYRQALEAGCHWILEIDAGFSHNPNETGQFFEKIAEEYDCVFGSRFCKGGQFTDTPFWRYFISRGGSVLANCLLGTKLKDMTSGFELFTNSALTMVLEKGIKSRGHFFQTEIKAYCRNLKVTEVPIHYQSPSQNVNVATIIDALKGLFGLFLKRLRGNL